MSFDRYSVQLYFERKMGCSDLDHWKLYRNALASYVLSQDDVLALSPLLKQDALSLYTKALQSFVQALIGLQRSEFSWTIVKMYYAVFYAMRSELDASSIISVKNGKIYYMCNIPGATFNSVQEKGSHKTYINLRKGMPASIISEDLLADNEIEDGLDVYSWMCSNRERVNYRDKQFSDPEADDVLQKVYIDYVKTHKMSDLLNEYESRDLFCFDKDHATIATPYKKLRICRDLMATRVSIDEAIQMKFASVREQLLSIDISNDIVDRLMLE